MALPQSIERDAASIGATAAWYVAPLQSLRVPPALPHDECYRQRRRCLTNDPVIEMSSSRFHGGGYENHDQLLRHTSRHCGTLIDCPACEAIRLLMEAAPEFARRRQDLPGNFPFA